MGVLYPDERGRYLIKLNARMIIWQIPAKGQLTQIDSTCSHSRVQCSFKHWKKILLQELINTPTKILDRSATSFSDYVGVIPEILNILICLKKIVTCAMCADLKEEDEKPPLTTMLVRNCRHGLIKCTVAGDRNMTLFSMWCVHESQNTPSPFTMVPSDVPLTCDRASSDVFKRWTIHSERLQVINLVFRLKLARIFHRGECI